MTAEPLLTDLMGASAAVTARGPALSRGLYRSPVPLSVELTEAEPETLPAIALAQAHRRAHRVAVHVKSGESWLPVTWAELHESVTAIAAGLVHLGLRHGQRLAILSENRVEWMTLDLAAQSAGLIVVPVYASSTSETIGKVLADSGTVAIVCSTPKQGAKVAEARARLPELHHVFVMDGVAGGGTLFADMVAAGTADDVAEVGRRLVAVAPEDVLTLIYTSGTTGDPKGVILTQANVVASCRAILEVVPVHDDDHGLSFLPWAHVYERVQGVFCGLVAGVEASIAPDLDHIAADIRSVRPSLMNAVPRVYEKMEEAIRAQIRAAGGWRAALGERALRDAGAAAAFRRGGHAVPRGLHLRMRVWEPLVLRKIRSALGGRARMFSSGGGPINLATLEFFDAVGIAITEGYGLTEAAGAVTTNDPASPRPGTVGRVLPGYHLHIAPDGEILVRGPGIMRGYWNKPAATAEVLQDGWLATGDIGALDQDGYLRITDRKKDLIVTAGGKNVAPAPIEAEIMRDPLVERCVLIGDGHKYLVALIVPEFSALRGWCSQNRVDAVQAPDTALVRHAEVQRLYDGIVARVSSTKASYESVKKVGLLERDLTEESGELTPSLKVKRRVVAEIHDDLIRSLYV